MQAYTVLSVIFIDQLLALLFVRLYPEVVKYNPGFAFGVYLFESKVFSFVIVLVFLLLFIYLFKDLKESLGFSLVLGGGLSNLIFRIFYLGFVVDYLRIPFFRQYNTFNLSDTSIVLGVILILLTSYNKHSPNHPIS